MSNSSTICFYATYKTAPFVLFSSILKSKPAMFAICSFQPSSSLRLSNIHFQTLRMFKQGFASSVYQLFCTLQSSVVMIPTVIIVVVSILAADTNFWAKKKLYFTIGVG